MYVPGRDMIELVERRVGDCGCPEEVYLFNSLDLILHFEPNGDVDGWMDSGDWEEETTETGLTPDAGRNAIFGWASSLSQPHPEK